MKLNGNWENARVIESIEETKFMQNNVVFTAEFTSLHAKMLGAMDGMEDTLRYLVKDIALTSILRYMKR